MFNFLSRARASKASSESTSNATESDKMPLNKLVAILHVTHEIALTEEQSEAIAHYRQAITNKGTSKADITKAENEMDEKVIQPLELKNAIETFLNPPAANDEGKAKTKPAYLSPGEVDFMAAQKILPGIYLGPLNATARNALEELEITHVLSCLSVKPAFPNDYTYLVLDLMDSDEQKIEHLFEEAITFIEEALQKNGRVLIHCAAGISRSATITIAYLMKTLSLSMEDALHIVHAARPYVCPNNGFRKQLKQYEQKLSTKK